MKFETKAAQGWIAAAGSAADWLPATLLVGVTGAIVAGGHDALAYILGFAGALFLWATVLTPGMAGSDSARGITSFLAGRYRSPAVGKLASAVLLLALVILLAAEITAAARAYAALGTTTGHISAALATVPFALGAIVLLAARSGSLSMHVGATLAALAFAILIGAVAWLAYIDGPGALISVPAMSEIATLEQGLLEKRLADPATFKPYAVPFLRTDPLNFSALIVCVSLGLAILATPSRPSRPSTISRAVLFVTAALIMLPPVAAAAKRSLLALFASGVRPVALPDWMTSFQTTGALEICGSSSSDPIVLAKACGKGVGPQGFMRWHDAAFAQDALVFAGLDAASMTIDLMSLTICSATVALTVWTARRIAILSEAALFPDGEPGTASFRTAFMLPVLLTLAALIAAARPADSATLLAWSATLAAAGLAPALLTALVVLNPGRAAASVAIPFGALFTLAIILASRYAPIDVFALTSSLSNAPPAVVRKLASLQDTLAAATPGPGRDTLLLQAEKLARDNLAWFGLKPLAAGIFGLAAGALIMAAGSVVSALSRR